ncbi:MAG: asparagine synthase-related protein, partial [Phycisphaerales bacterium]|nr:asparagine synthase-related protein [Phycisphaerales bacterium]
MASISTDEVAEFLVGPESDRTRRLLDLFSARLRVRGFKGEPFHFERAGSIGVVVCREETPMPGPGDGDFEILEDQWPEALGFRLACSGDRIEAESDHFSFRPMFWAKSKAGEFVGTSLQWVGAAVEAKIDPLHAFELLLVSYNIEDRCPLAGVHRMNPGRKWTKEGTKGVVLETRPVGIATVGKTIRNCTGPEGRDLLASVADRIAEMMSDNCCIELSGGVDSRCVVALGNWRGVRPKFAFTLGFDDTEDVRIAREVCKASGIEHRMINPVFDTSNIEQDARDYLEAASYQVNATSYCWMPALFRELAPHRSTQICGQMASSAYYYTPLDQLAVFDGALRTWVDKRLFMSGNQAGLIFGEAMKAEGSEFVR